MHKLMKSLAFLLALALMAAACGGDDEGDVAADAVETTTTTTTTTEAPATTVAETTTSSTTTTTEVPAGPTMPLSGVPIGDGDPADHAAVVIKISNNDSTARAALLGLDQADVSFEERIEQEATRFAAVFHSSLPTEVGSVRSGRTSDVQIVSNLNRPVFAFSGANDGVHEDLRQAETDDLLVRATNDFGDPQFRRISEFSAPNNLVVDATALLDEIEGGEPPRPIFDFSNNVADLGTPSTGVVVSARTDASYVWEESLGRYLRFQGADQLATRDDVDIAPTNVIILTTTYVPSVIDSQSVDAITVGSNPVVIYSNGFRVEGTWTRDFERDPYTFETSDGQTIGLAPGQTWVSLAPAGQSADLTQAQADALVG